MTVIDPSWPVYRTGTSKAYIIKDGWSRNFTMTQIMDELQRQGYHSTCDEVHDQLLKHDYEYEKQHHKPCPHDPRTMAGTATGMYHCPHCDQMVLAGSPH